MTAIRRTLLLAAVALLLGLGLSATASAADPTATTGGAAAVTSGGARLSGTVDPNGEPTTYFFEYGTTRRFGSRTADGSAGRAGTRTVRTDVTGLTPNTTYFYRLVASNPSGVASGQIRQFRTRPQPLGLQVAASPNPVTFGAGANLTGTLTGTGNAGRRVVLQQRLFPFTADFADVGAPQVTSPTGTFAFNSLFLPQTTQLRVRTDPAEAVSDVITVGVAVKVKTNVSTTRVTRGKRIRFSGTIRPARAGAQFAVQKRTRDGRWVVVAGGITRSGGQNFSGFTRRVRIPRGGRYRVFVNIVDGNLVSGVGREIAVSTRRAR